VTFPQLCAFLATVSASRPYIDWTPFFRTWEMKGRYPGVLKIEGRCGARSLFADARDARHCREKWPEA
jgi:cobalamin-dependent methionine synthase I